MYTGTLDQKKMHEIPLTAYQRYNHQLRRCVNPNTKSFKTYGAKGIRVEYGPRDFIFWFQNNIPGDFHLRRYDVGRKNHSGNYTLANIFFQLKSDNTKERNYRLGNPRKSNPVEILDKSTGVICYAQSSCEAARITGISQGTISWLCRKNKDTNNFYKFNFKGAR